MQRDVRRYQSNRFGVGQRPVQRFKKIKEFYDPSLMVRKAVEQIEETYIPQNQFCDFNIDSQLKRNIEAKGYKCPTPIQDQAIPALLSGKDVIGTANTGTGKTAAFLIPLINKVINDRNQGVLIVAPTRELACQIDDEFKAFSRQTGLASAVCIGGVSISMQISSLRKRPNFVIGTPGRLKDLEQRRELYFNEYTSIVLDEVDRMLDMGFLNDIRYMISRLPEVRQSLFFSATLPTDILYLAQGFLKEPVSITVKSANATATNVDQDIVRTNGRSKVEVLHELLIREECKKVLVFGRTKWGIEKLVKTLDERGFQVASIHGNKTQSQRQRALDEFKRNRVQVLLATDIASRGLDIDSVSHVINFDLPESYDDYIHRIGRTGRADKRGIALTIVEQ